MKIEKELIGNYLVRLLAQHSVDDIVAALSERESEILADIQVTRENLDEGKPLVFAFTFSGKLLLDKNTVETSFSYAVKKTQKEEHRIPSEGSEEAELDLWKEDA